MDPARFARIEELFHAAVERPAAGRGAFVLAAESDVEVRAAVERLLAQHVEDDAMLRDALAAATAVSAPMAKQIGPYRVLRELGAGGMGTVLLAERELGDTRQQVALKLIRGFPTALARERLARERNLLAGLNHSNIARLLDAGETGDGVPYLVMEYVEGEPLAAFCAKHGLDVAARLRLFAPLCRAVQHAHQRLIVHRDIKPGNVLVRDDGTPVLLDFGIGKLLDATERDATATRVFTPAYAAPEQRAGRVVTTATDIYGLGCIVHELLSERSLSDIADGEHIPTPSAVARDPARARALRGDLDTLVGKAMRAEPERRYASAQALADDIENWLARRPLLAAPDSVAYRARKFVARHRYGVAATFAAVALMGGFVWRLNAERQRAVAAETRAERQARSTRQSRDYLISLFEAAAPGASAHPLTARELIDNGAVQLQRESGNAGESAGQLNLAAAVYAALGDPKAAIASAERALALAAGDTPELGLQRADILLTLGSEYDNTERFDDARRADEQALALRERYAPEDRGMLAATLADLGAAALRRGETAVARGYFERAIDEYAQVANVQPEERANVLRGLAEVNLDEGKFGAAVKTAEQAVQALAGAAENSLDRIEPWRMLARAQIANVQNEAAVATLERALGVARRVLGGNSSKVANVENDIAVALNSQGRYRAAIAHLEQSIAITDKLRPGEPAASGYDRMNLGSIYESLGDYPRAEQTMRAAIAAMEAATPDEPQLDSFRGNLARTLMLRGDVAAAKALIERALAGIAARDGENSFAYAFQTYRLARIELAAGNPDAAEQALRDCSRTLAPMLPARHSLRAQFSVIAGMIAQARGDLAGAQREFETAAALQASIPGGDPVALAAQRMRVADVLLARGELAAARVQLDTALPVLEGALLPTAVEWVDAHRIAGELARREKPEPARQVEK